MGWSPDNVCLNALIHSQNEGHGEKLYMQGLYKELIANQQAMCSSVLSIYTDMIW